MKHEAAPFILAAAYDKAVPPAAAGHNPLRASTRRTMEEAMRYKDSVPRQVPMEISVIEIKCLAVAHAQ